MAECDTWDNALVHCDVEIDGREVPMRLETKRLAPGEMNTWYLEVFGTDGGVRFPPRNRRRCGTSAAARNRSGTL